MVVNTQPRPTSIREVYPKLPRNTDKLLDMASQGNEIAMDRLGDVIDNADYLDPWHKPNLEGIFGTHHSVRHRGELALEVISALDTIKNKVVPGEPFLLHETGQTSAGIVGEGPVDLKSSWPGLRFHSRAINVVTSNGRRFPDFFIRDSYAGFNFVPSGGNRPGAWNFLINIASGLGPIVFGQEHIKKNSRLQSLNEQFYSALALELAGIQHKINLAEVTKISVGEELVQTMAHSVSGLPSPDKHESVIKYSSQMSGHEHQLLVRNNSFQDLNKKEARAILNIVGLQPDSLIKEIHGSLDRMITDSEKSTMLEIAGAIAGRSIVERYVHVLYSD